MLMHHQQQNVSARTVLRTYSDLSGNNKKEAGGITTSDGEE
jgi:hypothetical protein